ncbi:MAG: hypothetical protein PHV43_02165 [Candidatus Colwellbacteria bacterium]|nr:hypothetical protein [Candidatus Colwellbacteria bacterium]
MNGRVSKKYEAALAGALTAGQLKRLLIRLERISCNIAPLNTATGNTHTIVRWQLPKESPHYATEDECERIFIVLMEDLLGLLGVKGHKPREVLNFFGERTLTKEEIVKILASSSRIGSLELPIEYKVALNEGGRHTSNNLFWYAPLIAVTNLRVWVKDPMIITKIQVKSFLTDRRQTGDYQTNREIRWETNPDSPQFATKTDCVGIELKLLAQISTFVGAPDLSENLVPIVEKALGQKFKKDSFKCPISGKPVFYNEFFEKVSSPVHGRSGYQVGHLNPLAVSGSHTAPNTSWITDLGNRVQGDSSLEEITNDIFFMAEFHKDRLGLDWDKVEEIVKKKQN